MILYHYTGAMFIDAIKAEGLTRGELAWSATEVTNAVWLTTDLDPSGHGLGEAGHTLTLEEKRALGIDPSIELEVPNKRAVRITVKIPSTDPKLRYWPKWARGRIKPDWYATLDEVGGGKAHTWWIYLGRIPPERFLTIEVLDPAEVEAFKREHPGELHFIPSDQLGSRR
jgi:hypothetical protein